MYRRFKGICSKKLTVIVSGWVELWVLFIFYAFCLPEISFGHEHPLFFYNKKKVLFLY